MIPLRDNIPSSRFPVVTVALVVLNAIAFLHELSLGRHLEPFLYHNGIVPAFYTDPELRAWVLDESGVLGLLKPIFTSMFLHGGWMHIIGNLWVLWIFGDNVEDRLGHFGYCVFYLLSGIAAGIFHILTNWDSQMPTIGASGAIAGVMGAYFMFYPRARILTLVPIFIFIQIIALPAVIFLGFWFLLQLLSGTMGLMSGGGAGGIAFWAHVGGFAFGALYVKLMLLMSSTTSGYSSPDYYWKPPRWL